MSDRRPLWLAALGTLALGGMLGYGVFSSLPRLEAAAPGARTGTRPAAAAPFPDLPAGLSRDANGMIKGLDLRVAPGSVGLEWETLGAYTYTTERGLADLPENLRALEGKKVTVLGYLMPFFEFDDIHQFALVGSCWSCCFGRPPTLAETLNVSLREGHPGLRNDLEPLRVVGTFHAKVVRESGYLLSIFSIEDAEAAPLR